VTEQFPKFEPCLVELRFAVAGGALEHCGNFIMLEALYVVKNKNHAIAGRKRGYGAFEGDAVDGTGELRVATAEVALWGVIFGGIDGLFEGDEVQALFAKVHEDEVDCEAMEPGGEGGFAPEAADLAEEVEEGLLGHVFGFRDVAEHAEAKGVDAAFVEGIEARKGLGVSCFCGVDRFGFAGDWRISLEKAWSRVRLCHL
jgi:hypothetical protein